MNSKGTALISPWQRARRPTAVGLLMVLLLVAAGAIQSQSRTALSGSIRIESITPTSLNPGQSATLMLRGRGLRNGLGIDLGEGVNGGTLVMINDSTARVTVRVHPGATPGQRRVSILLDGVAHPQSVTLTITGRTTNTPPSRALSTAPAAPRLGGGFSRPLPAETTGEISPDVSLRLLRVTPNRLQADHRYTLTLAGQGFADGMQVDFGAGIRLRSSLRVINATTASISVQVTRDAQPGFRSVTASLTTTSDTPGMLALPTETSRSEVPRALEIVGGAATAATPPTGGFAPPVRGGGFVPKPPAGGFAPPPTAQPIPTPLATPVITAITPSQLSAGQSYIVTLQGAHLNSSLQLDFGEGIQQQGALISIGNNKLQATLRLGKQTKAGSRQIILSTGKGENGIAQPAKFSVLGALVPKPQPQLQQAKLKLPSLQLTDLLKARIDLQTPDWRQQIASQAPLKDPVTGQPLTPPTPVYKVDIPLLHDEVMFSWKEANPGTAEWFEIRFYAKGKLTAKRRIDPIEYKVLGKTIPILPTWFRPDAVLLNSLLKPAAPTADQNSIGTQQAIAPQGGFAVMEIGPASQAAGPDQAVKLANTNAPLHWEVAGYRKYHDSGVVKTALVTQPIMLAAAKQAAPAILSDAPTAKLTTGFVETEVALSERWPLKSPSPPTGLNCSNETGGLNLTNLDKNAKQQGGGIVLEAGDGHVGDRFRIKGAFKLDNSPYASHPQTQQSSFKHPITGKKTVLATHWLFDNVFVDWGDGTVTPFSMLQSGDPGGYASGNPLSLGDGQQHSYTGTGPYTVRVYQLSTDDVQGGGQVQAARSIDHNQDLYAQVSNRVAGGHSGQQQMKWSKSVADRAFMVFCRNIQIEPRSDPASYGPLQLVDISIDGFAGQQAPAQPLSRSPTKPGSHKKPAAGPSRPTPAVTAGSADTLQLQARPSLNPGADLPTVSTCSQELTANASLRYTGQGRARLRWLLDGVSIGEDERILGPSQPRSQEDLVKLAGKKSWFDLTPVAPPRVDVESGVPSPPIGLSSLGKRSLKVEAEVVPEPKRSNLYDTLTAAFGANGLKRNPELVKALAGEFKNAPKVGVLSPHKLAQPGLNPVSYLNRPLQQIAARSEPVQLAALSLQPDIVTTLSDASFSAIDQLTAKKEPPNYVVSSPFDYRVVGADEKQACTFQFPVAGGMFTIAGLQQPGGSPKVTESNGRYSGEGTLLVKLPSGGDAVKQWPVPVSFKDWQLKDDGITVASGEFSITQTGLVDLPLPALKASVAKLQGKAGVAVEASLNARLAHPELREKQSGKPPAWQNVQGTLSPDGDWLADGLGMAETQLYLGGFRIDPDKVTLDLSLSEGSGADSACSGGAGSQFLGVHLGNHATLTAYDFGLQGTPAGKVDNWAIDAGGVCGSGQLGPFQSALDKGKIAWDQIAVTANGGKLKATYKNLRVTVPWINAELKGSGDPVFNAGQGSGNITLALTGEAAPVTNGPITLQATHLALTQKPGVGWAVTSDTRFNFAGADKIFAKDVWLSGLMFGLDGKAYLPNGSQGATLTSTSGFIAQGPVTLKSAKVTAPASGSDRLLFDFVADLKLSKALEAKDMPVSYRITEPGSGQYHGSGPVVGQVPITFAFPKTDTITQGSIHPEYVGAGSGSLTAVDPPAPLSWVTPAQAATKQVIYRGTADMNFLKSSALPVTGAFELGYFGSNDYWAAVLTYNISPPGITVVPNLLNLYGLGGGVGYNVEPGSLSHNLAGVTPKATDSSVYGANVTLGSAFDGGFAYTLKGYFNVDPKNPGLQMDFGLWLLTTSHSGSPPISGLLSYGSGTFHAEMGGEQSFLGGFARLKANPKALQAHFDDGGDWHLYAGTDSNPVEGEVAKLINGGVWLNLGRDEGLKVGAKADARFPDINCNSGTCANVSGEVQADVTITPAPQATAKNTVEVAANGCLGGGCLSLGVNADMTVAGPSPIKLGYGFSLNGCPIGKLSISLRVLPPPPDPGISGSLCGPAEIGKAVVEGAEKLGGAIGKGLEGAANTAKKIICLGFC